MKYKIGDKVKVRNDLKVQRYGDKTFVERMEKYKGKLVTISEEFPGFYHIKEDKNENWDWAEQMFEPVVELTAEEAIKIQAEMCSSMSSCVNCPIYKEKDGFVANLSRQKILKKQSKSLNSGRKIMRRKKQRQKM